MGLIICSNCVLVTHVQLSSINDELAGFEFPPQVERLPHNSQLGQASKLVLESCHGCLMRNPVAPTSFVIIAIRKYPLLMLDSFTSIFLMPH